MQEFLLAIAGLKQLQLPTSVLQSSGASCLLDRALKPKSYKPNSISGLAGSRIPEKKTISYYSSQVSAREKIQIPSPEILHPRQYSTNRPNHNQTNLYQIPLAIVL
jgi:hypothetical protein